MLNTVAFNASELLGIKANSDKTMLHVVKYYKELGNETTVLNQVFYLHGNVDEFQTLATNILDALGISYSIGVPESVDETPIDLDDVGFEVAASDEDEDETVLDEADFEIDGPLAAINVIEETL